MNSFIWIAAGLVLGSLPLPFWMGKVFLHKDIRKYGDGAPGATNLARAGSKLLYVIAGPLDAFKGAIPVWLAQLLSGVDGWGLAAVAVAPVLANAFTPFLKFRGGMSVAVTYGIWLGLLGLLGPAIIAAGVGIMFTIQKNWAWASIGGLLALLLFLLFFSQHFISMIPLLNDKSPLITTCIAHTVLQIARRYSHFMKWPQLQPWISGRG